MTDDAHNCGWHGMAWHGSSLSRPFVSFTKIEQVNGGSAIVAHVVNSHW